jgi:hypothetical protein
MLHTKVVHHITDHFAPTGRNGFIPRLLRERVIWAILGASAALFGFAQFLQISTYERVQAEMYPQTVLARINHDRSALGLAPLSTNPVLEYAATLKAADMVAYNYFAHISPTGTPLWHWLDQAGYTFTYAGEQLIADATHPSLDQQVVLSPEFTEIGIATVQGEREGVPALYGVALLGTPAYKQVAGKSVATDPIRIVDESQQSISIKNIDPALVTREVTPASVPTKSPWLSRFLLRIDKHIGTILEILIIGIILALVGLSTRQWQQHHHKHMAYGVLMVIILTSLLFVGRMGVFAETPNNQATIPYLEF